MTQAYVVSYHRQSVETAASLIQRLMPASIHAVTGEGFELKVVLFILESSINKLQIHHMNRGQLGLF